jgi:thymidine phosphorylase
LPAERIVEIVQEVGCVICGQTDRMVPADKRLYALRDVTGTVPSIPLIVASILSKKLAENLQALVLDVKFGSAAFMPTLEKAIELGQAMVALGNACGTNTRALITGMDVPLGRSAGNWLEVKESVACLDGNGEADLVALVLACAAHLLVQTGKCTDLASATQRARDCLLSGAPRKKWDQMLMAQGADLDAFNRKLALDHTAPLVVELRASSDLFPQLAAGTASIFLSRCDARLIGELVRDIGGGRLTKDAAINYEVGVDKLAKPGEEVRPGTLLARIHAADDSQARDAPVRLAAAFAFGPKPPASSATVQQVLV